MSSDDLKRSVILIDGPVGVGKTTLGRALASELNLGFIDGDDFSLPGPWYRSIRQTCHRIVSASEELLATYPAVVVAYPVRCTTWIFFHQTFGRKGIACHCVGLAADLAAISTRDRVLRPDEVARSEEMIAQGYGNRSFADVFVRTDEGDFLTIQRRLADEVLRLGN